MKKIILITCLFLLTGCTDYVEINDLAIVTGIALDYKDNEYEVSTELIINEKETEIKVYKTTSNSIEEALSKISKLCNKELFITDLKVLMITENIINNNVNYYDYFLRNSKSKMNFNVYLVNTDQIYDILNIYKDENGSSLYVDNLLKFNKRVFSSSASLSFIDLVKQLLDYGINPVYPKLILKENGQKDELYLDSLVSFNYNFEKVELNELESIFYDIITNNSKNTLLNINCGNNYFTLSLDSVVSNYKFKNNIFTINIKSKGKINSYHCDYNLKDSKSMKKLTNITNEYMTENIYNIIKIIKDNNNDFIGIGDYIYRHDNKYFNFEKNTWDIYINKINIKVNNNTDILSVGEIKTSIGDKYGKNK